MKEKHLKVPTYGTQGNYGTVPVKILHCRAHVQNLNDILSHLLTKNGELNIGLKSQGPSCWVLGRRKTDYSIPGLYIDNTFFLPVMNWL
jgi:hypothetical protein